MTLERLLVALADVRVHGSPAREISAVVHDSRAVTPGALFVALRGSRTDGAEFVGDAVGRGAAAVVLDEAHAALTAPHPDVATLVVPDASRALSLLAAAFYGDPSRSLRVVGITGTNGKTTTMHFVCAVLERAGIPCGRIGTLGAHFADASWALANTTPPADELQRTLAGMRDRGAGAVAMEVSSHALALGRVADVHVAIGALTNVTRDHLDFHGSLDAYAAAKRTLFERAEQAVLNVDDPYGALWATELQRAGKRVLTYGIDAGADVGAVDVDVDRDGSRFRVDGREVALRLPGRFNVSNALAAFSVARLLGIDDATTSAALHDVAGVRGRMERVAERPFDVYVDYAHTPDALRAALHAARDVARGRVIVVFGCGGDRDRGKRPEMGRTATELADLVILTSDNPRSEDPSAILAEVAAGAAAHADVLQVMDRRAAIAEALTRGRPGDVVLVAGKGHETYQALGDRIAPFDDAAEVRQALHAEAVPAAR